MKKFVSVFIFLLAVNLFVPVLYYKAYSGFSDFIVKGKNDNFDSDLSEQTTLSDVVTLYDQSTGATREIKLIDYLIGAAACEMPASYEKEAIKAQIVAIHSYYLYVQNHPDYLENGYITINENTMSGYAGQNKLMEFWQMNYYDYYEKFLSCANEVLDEIVTYSGKPALTTYYAVSCGKTQSSALRWQQDLPYLISVDSSFDAVSDDYLQIKTLSANEMYSILKINFPFLEIDEENPEEWFGTIQYAESGYAGIIPIGCDNVPADQFRTALSLPSSCIMVFLDEDTFSVVTKGYGHGVGLSQFGANQLSQQGKNYKEILNYYYPGTVLSRLSQM